MADSNFISISFIQTFPLGAFNFFIFTFLLRHLFFVSLEWLSLTYKIRLTWLHKGLLGAL